MGIRMDDIHGPTTSTTASTKPTSTPYDPQNDSPSLPTLIGHKDNLEFDLSALGSVLDSHGVTMSTTLTTFDGFPRADIDVAQIRTTRARIIRLRNDLKSCMKGIEVGLEAHFAAGAEETNSGAASTSSPRDASSTTSAATSTSTSTLAKIRSVEPSSPAATAGLRANDRIVSFGDANWLNHEKLGRVAQIVGGSEGRGVDVVVLREEADDSGDAPNGRLRWGRRVCVVVPRRGWGGRGLLGCHLVPE